jgi:hypothetical protein
MDGENEERRDESRAWPGVRSKNSIARQATARGRRTATGAFTSAFFGLQPVALRVRRQLSAVSGQVAPVHRTAHH